MLNGNSPMFNRIVVGIVVVLVCSWVTYVSIKGVSLDTQVAGVNTRVSVLEVIASTIREDVRDIKILITEVRNDQKRADRRDNR